MTETPSTQSKNWRTNMSDLISREALLKDIQEIEVIGFGGEYIPTQKVIDRITNAPAIQQGEAAAEVRCRDGEVFGYIGRQVIRDMLPLGTKLYTTPQQPQSVADALEEAAKILNKKKLNLAHCTNDDIDSHASFNDGLDEAIKAIRALIKRNAEGVE